jgi:hypothetical protein
MKGFSSSLLHRCAHVHAVQQVEAELHARPKACGCSHALVQCAPVSVLRDSAHGRLQQLALLEARKRSAGVSHVFESVMREGCS